MTIKPNDNSITRAYIGLGSNLANPIKQVQTAILQLAALEKSVLIKTSSLYRSPALEADNQPDYINAIAALDTQLNARQLLAALQQIEQKQYRQKRRHWEARTLDLDILLFGQLRIYSPDLIIPHPRLHERNFVLYPLAEIAPDLTLPNGTLLSILLMHCSRQNLQQITNENEEDKNEKNHDKK